MSISTTIGNVAIGVPISYFPEPDYIIQIRDVSIDLRDVVKMKERITELEEIVSKQQETINKLWYSPGMPGYEEAKADFYKNR